MNIKNIISDSLIAKFTLYFVLCTIITWIVLSGWDLMPHETGTFSLMALAGVAWIFVSVAALIGMFFLAMFIYES